MNISKNAHVSFQYILKDEKGALIETSTEKPSTYVHGHHQIMPLIENALEGKTTKDKVNVLIPTEKAYGNWDEKYVRVLPRSQFAQGQALEVGMKIHPDVNKDFIMKIVKIEGDNITIDANHPLAGRGLVFEIEVLEVREATEKEICDANSISSR